MLWDLFPPTGERRDVASGWPAAPVARAGVILIFFILLPGSFPSRQIQAQSPGAEASARSGSFRNSLGEDRGVLRRNDPGRDHPASRSLFDGRDREDANSARAQRETLARLRVTVTDENGVVVTSARIILTHAASRAVFRGESDYSGRREFTELPPGVYQLRVEKEGFYVVTLDDVHPDQTPHVEITLTHVQEFVEEMDVTYSPPAIDPTKTSAGRTLESREILTVPHPVTRDIRYALPLIPGIVQDETGQIHLSGSASSQTLYQLDGFRVADPATGQLDLRVSVDAVRSVDVQSSRYAAEYGRASGGVVTLMTGMGDDRYRFSATDFIPSFQNRKGLHINNWTPRATLSGPLRKRRAWFYEALDGEYDLAIVKELPPGADRNSRWRVSNLIKGQVTISSGHILTAAVLVNQSRSPRAGLSPLVPLEATVRQEQTVSFLALKDQFSTRSGWLLDVGFAASWFHAADAPHGSQQYVIRPDGVSGNFFRRSDNRARRFQGLAHLFLPPRLRYGRHELKMGFDIEAIRFEQAIQRHPIMIFRQDGTLARRVMFENRPPLARTHVSVSGYLQDRWLVRDRWIIEMGGRFDWDQILRQALVSPRVATSYLVRRETKITAGVGLFSDAPLLILLARPHEGPRRDLFYAEDGRTLRLPPVETAFAATERELKVPRAWQWSVGLEQKLPASMYLQLEVLRKRGTNGWAFVDQTDGVSRLFVLRPVRHDRYDAVQVSLRRTFARGSTIFVAYTRSAARSDAVLDYSLDTFTFSPQAGGPLPWDTPNRLVFWGWMPVGLGFDLASSLEWRDGFPFSVVNGDQQLVGAPNGHRFPAYFSLNLHVERPFHLFGFQWALRAGFNNLTGRDNPTVVNNNRDGPGFLTFSGRQGRTFTGRIRFLGRK